jgi:acetyltransferase-like isoleucine patch superfamily enzyme
MNERPLVEQLGSHDESPSRRYRRIFVGSQSLGDLLRYEFLTGLLGPMPGAAGYWLRARGWRGLFAGLGRGCAFGCGIALRSPGRITIGDRVMIDDLAVLDAKGEGSRIRLGNDILIGRNTILSCNEAVIETGDLISIGPFCFFASKGGIRLGSGVSIGSGTHLMAGGHVSEDPDAPVLKQARTALGITVEDNVWIGSGAKLLDGVSIGRNSIVAAGSVVSKDVPEYSIAMGNPARVVGKRK